ncbi:DUF998 domain-containing protein [Caldivirga maquilingensis]|uniref:DUF998 domain-containing protein n=1 Tax=Caldivirga maquilingensis (strain ATCC 700844 / DSM 13496 / JCM 10307 / IC-167) TaxID=397948 RepID=A8MCR4_CALMQ|nr:DUF998 domain-containing protein [Caldivirga maquilingensis]ABW01570.1 Protein of unknown function DUF998 [Caldivirga maquilingensis IC-167]
MALVSKILTYMGIAAAVLAWVIILTSISLNPWFNMFSNALSDLGNPHANYYWLYNYGLVLTATLMLLFSLYLLFVSENKVEAMGSSFVTIASIFLALIGIFHEGTYPHTFVSEWFFTQMDLAVVTWSIGLIVGRRLNYGIPLLLLGLIAPIPALLIKWPSTAILETYGIVIIDAWAIAATILIRSRIPRVGCGV